MKDIRGGAYDRHSIAVRSCDPAVTPWLRDVDIGFRVAKHREA